jgi:hypothetical protein
MITTVDEAIKYMGDELDVTVEEINGKYTLDGDEELITAEELIVEANRLKGNN